MPVLIKPILIRNKRREKFLQMFGSNFSRWNQVLVYSSVNQTVEAEGNSGTSVKSTALFSVQTCTGCCKAALVPEVSSWHQLEKVYEASVRGQAGRQGFPRGQDNRTAYEPASAKSVAASAIFGFSTLAGGTRTPLHVSVRSAWLFFDWVFILDIIFPLRLVGGCVSYWMDFNLLSITLGHLRMTLWEKPGD